MPITEIVQKFNTFMFTFRSDENWFTVFWYRITTIAFIVNWIHLKMQMCINYCYGMRARNVGLEVSMLFRNAKFIYLWASDLFVQKLHIMEFIIHIHSHLKIILRACKMVPIYRQKSLKTLRFNEIYDPDQWPYRNWHLKKSSFLGMIWSAFKNKYYFIRCNFHRFFSG